MVLFPPIFLTEINGMPLPVKLNILLYVDDLLLFFTTKIWKLQKQLNDYFSNICEWFIDNKLNIHFGEDETKLILFDSSCKLRKVPNDKTAFKGFILGL